MGIDMYITASKAQASSTTKMCKEQVFAYEQLLDAIKVFNESTSSLEGAAYSSAREYFTVILEPLARGGILLSEELEEDINKFSDKYFADVDIRDLKQLELETKIRQTKACISQLEDIREMLQISNIDKKTKLDQLNFNERLTNSYKETWAILNKKLERLLEFNSSSPRIFSEIEALYMAILQGVRFTVTVWNADTCTFNVPPLSSMPWREVIIDAVYTKKAKYDYSAYLRDHPGDLHKLIFIYKFEELNPNTIKDINKFLSPLELYDKVSIKYILYNLEPSYRSLCFECLGKLKIINSLASNSHPAQTNILTFAPTSTPEDSSEKYSVFLNQLDRAVNRYKVKGDKL